jgi:hypothetical protein
VKQLLWFDKLGEMRIEDDARSGSLKEAVTNEIIKKFHRITLNDLKVKLIEIAETLKISKERVGHIVHEYLDMRRLCANWVPRVLDQKQQRVDDSEQFLAIFNRSKIVDILQWVIFGCFTTLQSPNDSLPSGLNAMNRIQSVKRHNGQLARLWHQYYGICVVLYTLFTSKRARPSTTCIT